MLNINNQEISLNDTFSFLKKGGLRTFLGFIFIIPVAIIFFGTLMATPLNNPDGEVFTCITRTNDFSCMWEYSLRFKYLYIVLSPGIIIFRVFPKASLFLSGTIFPFLATIVISMFFYQTIGRIIDRQIRKSKEKKIKAL